MDTDKSQLQTMQERNTLLERDVKKYEERQQIEQEVRSVISVKVTSDSSNFPDRVLGPHPTIQGIHRSPRAVCGGEDSPANQARESSEAQGKERPDRESHSVSVYCICYRVSFSPA